MKIMICIKITNILIFNVVVSVNHKTDFYKSFTTTTTTATTNTNTTVNTATATTATTNTKYYC